MGLLDDAIREHLELKRRHGADPTEVERQEREAFGAAQRAAAERQAPEAEVHDVPETGAYAAPREPEATSEPPVDEVPDPRPDPAPVPSDPPPPPEPDPAPLPEPAAGSRSMRDEDVDVDWSDTRDGDPEAEAAAKDEESEDVLEETPDFLQETPEHDRLWFEQRPPRDFDF